MSNFKYNYSITCKNNTRSFFISGLDRSVFFLFYYNVASLVKQQKSLVDRPLVTIPPQTFSDGPFSFMKKKKKFNTSIKGKLPMCGERKERLNIEAFV